MRIEIAPSARQHLITDDEIRNAINFPVARQPIAARGRPAAPVLYVGAVGNEPHIEVIADHLLDGKAIVFHAMILRPSVYRDHFADTFNPRFAVQRA